MGKKIMYDVYVKKGKKLTLPQTDAFEYASKGYKIKKKKK